MLRDIDMTFEDAGIRFAIDFDTNGLSGQPLDVFAFFLAGDNSFIQNALPVESYYQTDTGTLIAYETVTPCCDELQAFSGANQVELYIPYNGFPPGTYSYYPVISVHRSGETAALETRHFSDAVIDVLGEERPAGYIVNYRIDELHVINTMNFRNIGYPEWDDLLLVYSLYEIDRSGEIIPGDQRYWANPVWRGNVRTEGFETILLDVVASSTLVTRLEFVEVADMDATKDEVDALQDAGKALRKGANAIIPRLARIAAKSALRYANGMLLLYDIRAFFERDNLFDVDERSYSPDDLYQLYLQTGAIRNQQDRDQWQLETFRVEESGGGHIYEMTIAFGLYGYPQQRPRE